MILPAIETFSGMALVYLLACLFTSSINEWIAQTVGRRGAFLDRGLRRLLPEEPVYRRLLHHPLISALYRDQVVRGRPPSYIAPESFALALVDIIHARALAIAGQPLPETPLDQPALRESILRLRPTSPRLAQSLLPILDRAGDDYGLALKGIEGWFSNGMNRVSGWYQARTRTILFCLGLAVAVIGDIDSITLARSFWATPAEWSVVDDLAGRTVAARPGLPDGRQALADLKALKAAGIPLGLTCLDPVALDATNCVQAVRAEFSGGILLKLIGWLLTALAISLGAPFWFQALSRIVPLRAAGPPPS
jgi:hypothetical protein